jgi:MYXO-CTERM domain-containing protein
LGARAPRHGAKPGGTEQDIAFTTSESDDGSLIEPKAALPEGEDCTIVPASDCPNVAESAFLSNPLPDAAYLGNRAAFHVAASAALPTSLGGVEAQSPSYEALELAHSGNCTEMTNVCLVRAKLLLSAEAAPWDAAFVYTTTVDGEPWTPAHSLPLPLPHGGLYDGRSADVFFSSSDTDRISLTPGKHEVVFHARLPGTKVDLATAPLTIDLTCPSTQVVNGDAGVADAGSRGHTDRSTRSSGCSVTQPGAGGHGALAWLLVGLVFRRRRSPR